jgi:hypothetical protein
VLFIRKKIEFPIPGHGYLLRGTGIHMFCGIMCDSCVSGGTAVMSDQAEKGGNFQFLGGNITGKFLEVKEDFLSKKSSDFVP